MTSIVRWVIILGFAIGAIFGLGGNVFPAGSNAQNILYAASSIGLAVASTSYAANLLRRGEQLAAAGFITLAIGEGLIWTGGPGSHQSFAAGLLYYVPALVLLFFTTYFAIWLRVAALLTAIPFGMHVYLFLTGADPAPSGRLVMAGYSLLTIATVGWIIGATREPPATPEKPATL